MKKLSRAPFGPCLSWASLLLLMFVFSACVQATTEATANSGINGLVLRVPPDVTTPNEITVFVGDEVDVEAQPLRGTDLSNVTTTTFLNGVQVGWSANPSGVLALTGPATTTTGRTGFLNADPVPGSLGVFTARAVGDATITAGASNVSVLDYYGNPTGARTATATLTVHVASKPSRVTLEPSLTTARAGRPIDLRVHVFGAAGEEIPLSLLHSQGYDAFIQCLDVNIGPLFEAGFPAPGIPNCKKQMVPSFNISAGGILPGTARYLLTIEKIGTSRLTLPDLRATMSVTYTKPAARITLDQSEFFARIGQSTPVRVRAFDADGREVPADGLTLYPNDVPAGTLNSVLLIKAGATANDFVITPRTLNGQAELLVPVSIRSVEGVFADENAQRSATAITASANVRIHPRVTGFLNLPTAITLIEGESQDVAFLPIFAFGSTTTPYPVFQSSSANDGIAKAIMSYTAGSPPSYYVHLTGVSAGTSGAQTTPVTVGVIAEEGATNVVIPVTVIRRTNLTAITLRGFPNDGSPLAIDRSRLFEVFDQANILVPTALLTFSIANVTPVGGAAVAELSLSTLDPGVNVLCKIPGTARITASAIGTTLQTTATVRCGVPTIRITSEPANKTIVVGSTYTYGSTVNDENGVVQPSAVVAWASSDANVARINSATGVVTAVSVGSVTITATTANASPATTTLTVAPVAATPVITFSPASSLSVDVASSSQVSVSVSNAVSGGTLLVRLRDGTLADFSQSSGGSSSASGSVSGKAAGTTFLDANYTANGATVTASLPVTVHTGGTSRVARVVIEPRDVSVTSTLAFSLRPRFLDAAGVALSAADVIADGGSVSFFNSRASVGTVVQGTTDPTTAQFTPVGIGTTNITLLYSKGGQNIAIDNTNVTVNAASAGALGSLQLVIGGTTTTTATRQLRAGESVVAQVVVRDNANVIVTSGVTGLTLTSSPGSGVTITPAAAPVGQPGYYYTIRAEAPGLVTLTATGGGVATSLYFVVTP